MCSAGAVLSNYCEYEYPVGIEIRLSQTVSATYLVQSTVPVPPLEFPTAAGPKCYFYDSLVTTGLSMLLLSC